MDKHRALLLAGALILTFVVVRAWLWFAPNADLNVGQYNIHHLYTGLLLITFFGIPAVLFDGNGWALDGATVGFGAGLGLALDEWVYLIATDGSNASYLLPVSFVGGLVMVALAGGFIALLYYWNRRGR